MSCGTDETDSDLVRFVSGSGDVEEDCEVVLIERLERGGNGGKVEHNSISFLFSKTLSSLLSIRLFSM